MRSLSIIMPAYNEEKRIKDTLLAYSKYFNNLSKKINYNILVVINNTSDNTQGIVKQISKTNKKITHITLERGGKGYATLEGFKLAIENNSDLIGFVDADLATPPEAFFDLVKGIENYDAAIASRYIPGAIVNPKPTIPRYLVSRIYNSLIRAVFLIPHRDTQCGAKLFKLQALKEILPNIGMTRWAFDFDLIYNLRKQNFRIKDIPTKWSDKEYSKINLMEAGPFMALSIIRLRILNSPLKRFIRVYDAATSLIKK
jgi:glycosyltransferase involved in cell wall biosynthesis